MPEVRPSIEIPVQEVKRMLDAGEDFLLLDVRGPKEHQIARIEGSVLIPLAELPSRLPELRSHAGRTIVAHCHHGGRSLQAATWLRAQGFADVRNMTGGIDAWSLKVDPKVPRY
ncbi:MAG: rhodanese [Phycisphaerae bacterium]